MSIRFQALATAASTAIALFLTAVPAAAGIIDFAPLTNAGDYMFAGNPYVESGFSFQSEWPYNDVLFSWGANNANKSADPTGGTLNPSSGGATTVTRTAGGTFDFLTVDLNDIYNNYYGDGPRDVEFTFTSATATTHQFVTVDANPGFQTFTFNQRGLISATFTTTLGYGQIQTDNFVLNPVVLAGMTTVDFTPLTNAGDYMFAGNPYVESGFRFQNEWPYDDVLFSWGANNANKSADPTGGTLNPSSGGATTVTRSDGGTFDFLTVDLNDIYNNYYGDGPREVEFAFTDAAGTTYQTVTVDSNQGFEHFAFNKHGLRSMSFATALGYGQIQTDNFVFGATTVPEPEGWALMIAGFGMVGGALRSRRKAALTA